MTSRVIFLPQVTQAKLYPWTALVVLTALNLLNYVDRSVLFAVQPLVQTEFHLTNAQVGYLTTAVEPTEVLTAIKVTVHRGLDLCSLTQEWRY